MITKRTYVLAAFAAMAIAVGCGHKSKKDDAPAATPTAAPTAEPTTTPTTTPTAAPDTPLNSLQTLQACFKIPAAEVMPIIAADEATAKTQATAVCASLTKANYAAGVSLIVPASAID